MKKLIFAFVIIALTLSMASCAVIEDDVTPPEAPGNSEDIPDIPETPDTPNEPDNPNDPDLPEDPDQGTDIPKNPDQGEDTPDIPKDPDDPTTPDEPDQPTEGGDEEGGDEEYDVTVMGSPGLYYNYYNGGYSVSIGTCTDTEIYIPATYWGSPVTSVYGFDGATHITSVTLPEGLKSISMNAFSSCTSLKSINIPASVTHISMYAFLDCTALETVTLYEGLTEIGEAAFANCTALTSITLPDSLTKIESSAFSGCTSLETVTLGNNIAQLGTSAFYGCEKLKYNEHEGLYYIGSESNPYLVFTEVKDKNSSALQLHPDTKFMCGSFSYCTAITEAVVPEGITTLPYAAFKGCTSLLKTYISPTLKAGATRNLNAAPITTRRAIRYTTPTSCTLAESSSPRLPCLRELPRSPRLPSAVTTFRRFPFRAL